MNPDAARHEGLRRLSATWFPPAARSTFRLRLTPRAPRRDRSPRSTRSCETRRREADAFYAAIHPPDASDDERLVQRQAFAGMLWTKQIYLFDVNQWLDGDNPRLAAARVAAAASATRTGGTSTRCASSRCRTSGSTRGSRPGTWPSTRVPLALVDPEFAKEQLWLLLFEQFQHPTGQIPAYEWEFSDLNPPVHAWAVWRVYNMDRIRTGHGRPRVPGEVLPQAADQLRLVGEQGRPRGQQRLRGRLPRPRQHHRHRPQRAAARRARCSSSPTPRAGWGCSA